MSKRKLPSRNKDFIIHCGQHTGPSCPDELCTTIEAVDRLSFGKLPRNVQVIGRLLQINTQEHNRKNIEDVSMLVSYIWAMCNIYTIRPRHVATKLEELKKEYSHLKNYPKAKKKETYLSRLKKFRSELPCLFDIKCNDQGRIKNQELLWGVKMEKEDVAFYENQRLTPPIGCCTSSVDKISMAKSKRMKQKLLNEEKQVQARNEYEEQLQGMKLDDHLERLIDSEFAPETPKSSDQVEEEFTPEVEEGTPKRRYEFSPSIPTTDDDMPVRYRHVRDGMRKVRPEIYQLAAELESDLHMSRTQIEESICRIANLLMGRKWKTYKPNEVIDNDTLPSMTNLVRTRSYIEAMALNSIVEEIMTGEGSSVTYSNDGSSMNKVGSYVVQSLTINGIQRALPPLPIVTESHDSLADMEKTTLKILSASTGYKYSERDILSKIDFVMTDSTAHNIGVIERVCQDLEVESVPKTLLCNVHPLMMFQGKIKEFFNDVQKALGTRKLDECFTVDVDFKEENFVMKSIKCLSNFVNRNNSAKPWNRFSHFSKFISPKKNETIELKDHRFNRLNDCCLVLLYHLDDIKDYLVKFSNITNNMAIIDRSFVEMADVLKPLFAATALLGVHITRPFHSLLLDVDTSYSVLLTTFPKLYDQMIEVDPALLLTTNHVVKFTSQDMFKSSLPSEHLLKNLVDISEEYKEDVVKALKICLEKFSAGFMKQKGAIFGFGETLVENRGNDKVLKVHQFDDLEGLDKAPVHNLGEERSVGLLNYEINLRGKQFFKTAAQNIVNNKAIDLIKRTDFKRYKKEADEIGKLKREWSDKMAVLEEKGLNEKEALVLSFEGTKLKDLQYLKAQQPPGPFTTTSEVQEYLDNEDIDESKKNERMYKEVRFAKHSSTRMKRSAELFRLRKGGKNLSSEDYAHNLKIYLGAVSSLGSLNPADLSSVLTGLQLSTGNGTVQTTTSSNSGQSSVLQSTEDTESTVETRSPYTVGTHIAAVWENEEDEGDDQQLNWFIGVVDRLEDNGAVISYLKRTKRNNHTKWSFPESANRHLTPYNQIIFEDFDIEYSCVTIIRCSLQQSTVHDIVEKFEHYISVLA